MNIMHDATFIASSLQTSIMLRNLPIKRTLLIAEMLDAIQFTQDEEKMYAMDIRAMRAARPIDWDLPGVHAPDFRTYTENPYVSIHTNKLFNLPRDAPMWVVEKGMVGIWWLITKDRFLSMGQAQDVHNSLKKICHRRDKDNDVVMTTDDDATCLPWIKEMMIFFEHAVRLNTTHISIH